MRSHSSEPLSAQLQHELADEVARASATTACSVRPGSPPTPRAGVTSARRTGGSGAGRCAGGVGAGGQGLTGLPRTAPAARRWRTRSGLGSAPSGRCQGTTSRCASGICAATSRALAVGVRRSSAPLRISVGTFGSGASSGAAAGVGERPVRAGRDVAEFERVGRGERRERARAQRAGGRRGLCEARAAGSRRGSTGSPALRSSSRSTAACRSLRLRLPRAPGGVRRGARAAPCRRAAAAARPSGVRRAAAARSRRRAAARRARPRTTRRVCALPSPSNRACPSAGRRPSLRHDRARSATGLAVMCAHAPLAHSWRRMRGTAAKVERSSGSGPFGGTTESSTSASTWVGYACAYSSATFVP